jgi:polar amino acid transport system substrate-binding protein
LAWHAARQRRRALHWLSCLAGALLAPCAASAEGVVRLASDDWCPFVCTSGGKVNGGYLVELTAQAMGAMGYGVEPVLMPLNRAIRETSTGEIEGVYAPPLDRRLRLSAPLAHSRACFYTRVEQNWTYQGLASLAGHTIGAIDDYGYDDGPMDAYILNHRDNRRAIDFSFGPTAGTTNLQKLLGGRFPILLEHEAVVAWLARTLMVEGQFRQAGCLKQSLPLTIGFALDDRRTPSWIRALADGLRSIDAAGTSRALRERYGIPVELGATPTPAPTPGR